MNPLSVFAMLSDRPGFEESFIYQMTGLIVVFTALGLIWLCLTLVGQYFKKTALAPSKDTAATPVPAASDLSPELVAVIVASVQMAVDSPLRIQAIVPVRSDQIWATEGRRRIFSSHTVR